MADEDSDSRFARLRRLFQRAFLTHVPDHPAHGGNTGETEWPPAKTSDESAEDPDRDSE